MDSSAESADERSTSVGSEANQVGSASREEPSRTAATSSDHPGNDPPIADELPESDDGEDRPQEDDRSDAATEDDDDTTQRRPGVDHHDEIDDDDDDDDVSPDEDRETLKNIAATMTISDKSGEFPDLEKPVEREEAKPVGGAAEGKVNIDGKPSIEKEGNGQEEKEEKEQEEEEEAASTNGMAMEPHETAPAGILFALLYFNYYTYY